MCGISLLAHHLGVLCIVVALVPTTSSAATPCTPILDWVVTPLRPGETALATGACLTNATIRVCSTEPHCFPNCTNLLPVQKWDGSIKAPLPRDFPLGVLTFTAVSPDGAISSNNVTSNAPVVDWFSTDSWVAGAAMPGGDLILYGKALAFSQPIDGSGVLDCRPLPPLLGGAPALVQAPNLAVRLRAIPATSVSNATLSPTLPAFQLQIEGAASCYRLATRLPQSIPDGNYSIEINNGLLGVGDALPASAQLLTVSVASGPRWRNATWTVGVHCNTTDIGSCLAKARTAGGGTVRVPPGFYRIPAGRTLGIGAYVALSGTTSRAADTVLSWDDEPANGRTCALSPWNPNTPRYPCSLLYNVETYNYAWSHFKPLAIRNLTLLVTSPAYRVIQLTDCTGCEVLNVVINVTIDANRFPALTSALPFPPLYVHYAKQWRAVGLRIVSGGGNDSVPRTDDPVTAPFRLEAVNDGRLWDVVAGEYWAGWSASCLDRVSFERTNVRAISPLRQRGNALTPFCSPVDANRGNDHVYFGQNYDAGTDALHAWETFTQDGAGGSYAGIVLAISVNTATGRQTLQTGAVRPPINARTGNLLLAGQSVSVMGGAGLGQWRRIVAVEPVVAWSGGNATANATLTPTGSYLLQLETPFTLPLAVNNSVIAVSTYKGNLVFEGNEWTNGTIVQTYGSSLDLVFSGNVLRNFYSGGLGLWGLGMVRSGWQPALRMVVDSNTLLCSGNLQSFTSVGGAVSPDIGFNASTVVLNYAHVIRRNSMPGSLDITVKGQVWDAVVEGNTFANATCPVKVLASCPDIGGCNSVFSTGQYVSRGPGSVKVGGGNGYDAWQVPRFIHVSAGALPNLPSLPSCLPTPPPSHSPTTTPPPSPSHTSSASSSVGNSTTISASTSGSASSSVTISATISHTISATVTASTWTSMKSTAVGTPSATVGVPAAASGVNGSGSLSLAASAGLAVGVTLMVSMCVTAAVVAMWHRRRMVTATARRLVNGGMGEKRVSTVARSSWAAHATTLNPSHALAHRVGREKELQLPSMLSRQSMAIPPGSPTRWEINKQRAARGSGRPGGRASRFGMACMMAKHAVPGLAIGGVNSTVNSTDIHTSGKGGQAARMSTTATAVAVVAAQAMAGRRQSHLPLAFSNAFGSTNARLSVHRSYVATTSRQASSPPRASMRPAPGSTPRASAAQTRVSVVSDSTSLL